MYSIQPLLLIINDYVTCLGIYCSILFTITSEYILFLLIKAFAVKQYSMLTGNSLIHCTPATSRDCIMFSCDVLYNNMLYRLVV